MTTIQQLALLAFVLIQSIGFSQTENTETTSKKQDISIKMETSKTEDYTDSYAPFLGTYLLAEGDFELEIIIENNKPYIVTEFSKDILVPINETTLREFTRGVDLELIKGNPDALKFTQNGYETTIKRVTSKTQN